MKLILAIFLVLGTSVGAGMLALPVEVGRSGFIPSLSLFVSVWLVMLTSGLLFAEVLVKEKTGANFTSLSERLLGKQIMGLTLLFYFLLFFSLITAYIKAMGGLLSEHVIGLGSSSVGSLCFVGIMIPVLYRGTQMIGKINGFLTIVLCLSYVALIFIGVRHINVQNLISYNWKSSLPSLSLVVTSFGFHGTLPSLVDYLDRNLRQIRLAIVIGTGITLLIYILWQLVALGSVPIEGAISLTSAFLHDQTAITPMSILFKHSSFAFIALLFSFAAMLTSFLGVSLGLIDFVMDATKLPKSDRSKILTLSAIYIPALFLACSSFRIFHLSLKYGAGIASVFLLILLPTLMHRASEELLVVSYGSNVRTLTRHYIQTGLIAFCAVAFLSSLL